MNLQVNLDARAILVIRHVPSHREILGSVTASPLALGAGAIAHIPREAAGAAHAEAGGARCGLSDVVREKKRDVLVDVLRDRERSHQPVVAEFRVRNVDSAGAGGDCVVVSVCVQEEEQGGAKGGGGIHVIKVSGSFRLGRLRMRSTVRMLVMLVGWLVADKVERGGRGTNSRSCRDRRRCQRQG